MTQRAVYFTTSSGKAIASPLAFRIAAQSFFPRCPYGEIFSAAEAEAELAANTEPLTPHYITPETLDHLFDLYSKYHGAVPSA